MLQHSFTFSEEFLLLPCRGQISHDYEKEFPSVEVGPRQVRKHPEDGRGSLSSVRMHSQVSDLDPLHLAAQSHITAQFVPQYCLLAGLSTPQQSVSVCHSSWVCVIRTWTVMRSGSSWSMKQTQYGIPLTPVIKPSFLN